jgi:osmoprotectant transport system ATP-binding protein
VVEVLLQLESVSKSFGAAAVLQPTDLEIPAGLTTVLIGPSGCGKTTLLRLMNGLVRPDAGQVRFRGERLDAFNMLSLRTRMGYVVQDGGLFPHLDAAANATLMARHLGWPEDRIAARLRELAELTRFPGDALARYPIQLSGGQRQRVALMRALMLDPELLLLDEPLGALDPLVRRELQEDLAAVFRALGKTVVLVTHDLAEAAFFAARIVLLRAGRVVQQGTIDDLVSRPSDPFVTAFVRAQRPLRAVPEGAPA